MDSRAVLISLCRAPQWPSVRLRTFLCFLRAVTPRLTRGIALLHPRPLRHGLRGARVRLDAVGQQLLHLERIALGHDRRLAQRAVAGRILLAAILGAGGFHVHELAGPGGAHALGGGFMRLELLLWHGSSSLRPIQDISRAAGPTTRYTTPLSPRTELV